jgi:hypothetical protein
MSDEAAERARRAEEARVDAGIGLSGKPSFTVQASTPSNQASPLGEDQEEVEVQPTLTSVEPLETVTDFGYGYGSGPS